MATQDVFLAALEKGRSKLLDAEGQPRFREWNRKIVYCFTDLDECWFIDVVNGVPSPLQKGEVDDPDIQFTMTSDVLVGLMDKRINGMRAFTAGQVKVKASMLDFQKLQTLM